MTKLRRLDWPLLAILLVSIGVRAAFAALPRMVRWDEASYLMIARNMLAGQGYRELVSGFDMHQPPMITLLAAAGLWLHLPFKWAGALPAHVLLGGAAVLPVYALSRSIYNRQAALLAALLTALYPALAVGPLYWGSLTESVALLLIVTGVYAAYRAGQMLARGRYAWGWAALMGVCFGLGYLARPESLIFAVTMAGYLAVLWLLRHGQTLRHTLLTGVVMGSIMAAVMTPYVVYLHRITGYWTLSGKAGTGMEIAWALINGDQALHDKAAASFDSSGENIIWLSTESLKASVGDWIKANPQRFTALVKYNMRNTVKTLFSADMLSLPIVGLATVGLFSRPWTRQRWRGHLLLALAVLPIVGLWMAFIEQRLLLPYVALGVIVAGEGLAQCGLWAGNLIKTMRWRRLGRIARLAPAALMAAWLVWSSVSMARADMSRLPFYRLEAARWLAEHTAPDTRIMTRNAETVLYADRTMVAFPNAPWPQVVRYAQSRNAAYLVLDEWEINTVRPWLAPLLAPSVASPLPEIVLVHTVPHEGHETYIYRFVETNLPTSP